MKFCRVTCIARFRGCETPFSFENSIICLLVCHQCLSFPSRGAFFLHFTKPIVLVVVCHLSSKLQWLYNYHLEFTAHEIGIALIALLYIVILLSSDRSYSNWLSSFFVKSFLVLPLPRKKCNLQYIAIITSIIQLLQISIIQLHISNVTIDRRIIDPANVLNNFIYVLRYNTPASEEEVYWSRYQLQ